MEKHRHFWQIQRNYSFKKLQFSLFLRVYIQPSSSGRGEEELIPPEAAALYFILVTLVFTLFKCHNKRLLKNCASQHSTEFTACTNIF